MKINTNNWVYSVCMTGVLVISSSSCKKDVPVQLPALTTSDVIAITANSASSGGTITSEGSSVIKARGVCWNTATAPLISNSKTVDVTLTFYSSIISGLTENTKYYVRAYATNSSGTTYGNEITFTTLPTSIKIGNQTWMEKNLNVTQYQNGDLITNVTDGILWISVAKPAYSDYDNTAANSNAYGHLYNWYAVTDSRNLCPIGWHAATDADWTTLTDFLGGLAVAGGKMKETGSTHWRDPNVGATNESGFTALPAGNRLGDGTFQGIGTQAYWWTVTEASTTNARYRSLNSSGPATTAGDVNKALGFSVRCVKDN